MRGPRIVLTLSMLALLAGAACGSDKATDTDKERAIATAQTVYQRARANGTDLANGPCIADEVISDWSADIAHNPRQKVDDQAENQCQAYRDGKTHHFVELDPEGNVIRAK